VPLTQEGYQKDINASSGSTWNTKPRGSLGNFEGLTPRTEIPYCSVRPMAAHTLPRVEYNVRTILEDMAARGWMNRDLAREAGLGTATISRFLNGEAQTAKAAKKIATALGRSVRRYLVTAA
jgi:lambda repressor-like predicted transcriptional regulator